jgi:hypothetical protein
MKTLVTTADNLSRYIFDDAAAVTFEVRQVVRNGETVDLPYVLTPSFTVADLNAGNSALHEGVTPPEDWVGTKYFYVDGVWSLNPDYEDPEEVANG